jgi:hypothetical protein
MVTMAGEDSRSVLRDKEGVGIWYLDGEQVRAGGFSPLTLANLLLTTEATIG